MKRMRFLVITGVFLALGTLWMVPSRAADGEPPSSVEERRLRISIREELAQIRQKADGLRMKEIELKTLKGEVDKKLVELSRSRAELAELLAEKDEVERKKIRELAKMYEKMAAPKAAAVMVALEEELAIEILGGIKSKSAGKILNNMDKAKAARLSKAYSTLGPD